MCTAVFTEVKLFVCMFCKAELLFIEVAQFCKQATRLLLKDMSHAGLGSVPQVQRLQIGKFLTHLRPSLGIQRYILLI